MACSKFEYVKQFESHESMLLNCYIVVRIDGKGFHKFTDIHKFEKPNDVRGLNLMNKAAQKTMEMFKDIFIAYGQSDEFSFVLHKDTKLYKRRSDKISSTIVSCFTSNYVIYFKQFFPDQELLEAPIFDSRCVLYPSQQNIRDYLSWRQADCHINNLYNTCFWLLVNKKGMSTSDAQNLLKDTDSAKKNELLFQEFGINYNQIEEQFKKGNILIRTKKEKEVDQEKLQKQENFQQQLQKGTEKMENLNLKEGQKIKQSKPKLISVIETLHCDIIQNDFWKKYEKQLKEKLY
ncbi:hypothetical protein PPERSA_12347 [Pseudocohnilembus persalinus]|uniref:tRNA(His) guanylyltransferase n=1 Tax=Pseudocohnilembus persalinus TaxID=266149 RepID=A0A0V0R1N0_PSEPJ|nr:hypothetical protein PPERSA_12347 [Pseudocohnilembus persalinus]|eukprot:KRX08192.1 hypothetical protein PPERSA_12347 [Pseudocohnilembus persalinus]